MDRKVALITGGSRGIGKQIALDMASEGYDIAITYNVNADLAEQVASAVRESGVDCITLKCDIAEEMDVKTAVYQVMKRYGRIDVLVNNASIAIDSLFSDKTVDNFRRTLDVNLIGTFVMSKVVGEEMLKNKRGKIINISSTNGINTYFPMCLDYDASKAGIISITHNLAMQFSPYINVNAIAPGFIATASEVSGMDEDFIRAEEEKIFLKRAGTEKDVSNLVVFLASDKADYINNEVIRIDGGLYGN